MLSIDELRKLVDELGPVTIQECIDTTMQIRCVRKSRKKQTAYLIRTFIAEIEKYAPKG